MKFFNILTVTFSMIFALFVNAQENQAGNFYGEEFQVLPKVDTVDFEKTLDETGSVQTQLVGKIKEVCQVKGCWMKVALDNKKEVFVRFKDYGFFVPTDSTDKEVVINGAAFVANTSVEDQKHYAKDSGASANEIAKITEPKQELRFEAEGVFIRGIN